MQRKKGKILPITPKDIFSAKDKEDGRAFFIRMAIPLLGTIIVVASMMDLFFIPKSKVSNEDFPEALQVSSSQFTHWKNPSLPWYERYFCLGSHRAFFCDENKFRHPFAGYLKANNLTAKDFVKEGKMSAGMKKERVIQYKQKI